MKYLILCLSSCLITGCIASYENTSCVKIDDATFGLYTKHKYSFFNDMSAILDAHHKKAVEVTRNYGGSSYTYIVKDDDGYFRRGGPRPLKIKGKFDILIEIFEDASEGGSDVRNFKMQTNEKNTCRLLN